MKASTSPFFAPLISVGSREGNTRPQAGNQVDNFFVYSGKAKDNKKVRRAKDGRVNSSMKDCICRKIQERAAVEGAGPRWGI